MKKILIAVIFILGFNYCYAQPAQKIEFVGVDSLINTDTVVKNITLSTTLNGIVLQPVFNRVSGTAAGKFFLAQSIDGTNFITTDSLILSNQLVNTALITKSQPTALYYRLTFISSGTVAMWPELWYLPRKEK
jgi:hypothetical protein